MRAALPLVLFLVACGGSTGPGKSDGMASSPDAATHGVPYMFSGPSVNALLIEGEAKAVVTLPSSSAYPGMTQFTLDSPSPGGGLAFSEAYDHAVGMTSLDDVMPNTLPSAQDTSNSPMLYYSVVNDGAAIAVPTMQLAFTGDAGGAFAEYLGADISCEVAFYDASTQAWTAGGMVSLDPGASSFTIPSIQPMIDPR